MSDHESTGAVVEPDGGANVPVQVEGSPQRRVRESHFTDQVIDTAHHYGWRPFHLRDRESASIVRGRGFPDLVMYRLDADSGQTELLAAELKRGYDSELREEQREWLGVLKQHIPAYEWRPENWDEIERVLQYGPALDENAAAQPTERRRSNSQIPRNFREAISNLVETIEGKELGTGNQARLRRMDPNAPDNALFWQLMSRDGMPHNPDLSKWGLILHGMALMSHGAGVAHQKEIAVGRALYWGDRKNLPFYSEDRLATLLAARGQTLYRLLARLFRMLDSKHCAFDWWEMAWFILNEDNTIRAEDARAKIAREYYRAAQAGS